MERFEDRLMMPEVLHLRNIVRRLRPPQTPGERIALEAVITDMVIRRAEAAARQYAQLRRGCERLMRYADAANTLFLPTETVEEMEVIVISDEDEEE